LKRTGLVVLASCAEPAAAYRLPVTNTPTLTELAPFEFANASDEIDDGCAPPSTRDVMLELVTPIAQTFVVDATMMDVALSIHDGPCPGSANFLACASATTTPPSNGCGVPSYNAAIFVAPSPHAYCLVVSETTPSSQGSVTLRVFAGGIVAAPLDTAGMPSAGDACAPPTTPSFSCVAPPGDRTAAASVLLLCPGGSQLMGSVIPDPALTPAVAAQPMLPVGPEVLCAAGTTPGAPLPFAANGLSSPAPYWFFVEPATPAACGGFRLSVTAR
jgi:hypothetical protein